MRTLTGVVVAFMVLWGGYWFVGARALDRAVTGWIDGLPAAGIPSAYTDIAVRGFPNRFDLAVTDPAIGPAGLHWRAPFLHLLALSYQPYRMIAVWPNSQSLDLASQSLDLSTTDARASVRFSPSLALPLDHLELVADGGLLVSDAGWQISFDQIRFATRQAALPNSHRLGLEAVGLTPDPTLTTALSRDGTLPPALDALHLDATVTLDRPLDRNIATTGAKLLSMTLASLRIGWGPMRIDASGDLRPDANGFAEGQITLRLTDWAGMIARARAAGLITQTNAGNLQRGLQALQDAAPDPNRLDVPLTFSNGLVRLGGLPVLPAPRF